MMTTLSLELNIVAFRVVGMLANPYFMFVLLKIKSVMLTSEVSSIFYALQMSNEK